MGLRVGVRQHVAGHAGGCLLLLDGRRHACACAGWGKGERQGKGVVGRQWGGGARLWKRLCVMEGLGLACMGSCRSVCIHASIAYGCIHTTATLGIWVENSDCCYLFTTDAAVSHLQLLPGAGAGPLLRSMGPRALLRAGTIWPAAARACWCACSMQWEPYHSSSGSHTMGAI